MKVLIFDLLNTPRPLLVIGGLVWAGLYGLVMWAKPFERQQAMRAVTA